MDVEAAIYGQLASCSALVALVGDRIYPSGKADPDSPRPLVVYSLSSADPMRQLDGTIAIARYTVSVEALAIHKEDAKAVADAADGALDRQVFNGVRAYQTDRTGEDADDGYLETLTYSAWQ